MKRKVVEWNENEKMSKEYALAVIAGIRQFYRCLYYQPTTKPFNGCIDYESKMQELDGLEKIIVDGITG